MLNKIPGFQLKHACLTGTKNVIKVISICYSNKVFARMICHLLHSLFPGFGFVFSFTCVSSICPVSCLMSLLITDVPCTCVLGLNTLQA